MADDNDNAAAYGASSSTRSQQHFRQKRARTQLSCTPCRTGKLKCDRASPCEPCVKRGREGACTYPPPPVKSKPANVKGRIRHLESLVVDLMNQQKSQQHTSESSISPTERTGSTTSEARHGAYAEPTPPSDHDSGMQYSSNAQTANSPESGVERSFGHMNISKNEISYHGESHWQTILSSLTDLKNDLGDDEEAATAADEAPAESAPYTGTRNAQDSFGMAQPQPSSELGLLLGSPIGVTKDDLIKAIPEKRVADRLLSLWFNSPDPFKPIIHAPTFQDEYKKYWKDPKSAPVMWIGLTLAILSLAESFALRDADPGSSSAKACLARVEKLHSLAASAAVLADFTTPKKYTLECLIFYASGLRSNDGFMKVWLMVGMILRLALRMGYHRDPKFYPNISAFDGEMRRRVWSAMSMIDIIISFQLGLPSMVRTITTDTEPPQNLLDRDFNPSSKVLPPGRSIDELTPASYARTKVVIVRIFAQAADLGHSIENVEREAVMRLDDELNMASQNMPPALKMPDMSEIVTDPPEQLMCRINLALLVLKTRIILHRNLMLIPLEQLSVAEQEQGVGNSSKICLEAALSVLRLQHSIYAESQVGGKLYTVKWYMGSISTHDFLLAAMVICLGLSWQIDVDDQLRLTGGQLWCPRRQAMVEALEKSQKIWASGDASTEEGCSFVAVTPGQFPHTNMTSETEKASKAMTVMLDRVRVHFAGRPVGDGTCGAKFSDAPEVAESVANSDAPLTSQGVAPNMAWENNASNEWRANNAFQPNINFNHQPGEVPLPSTLNDTPEDLSFAQDMPGIDFSAIGDMIDGPSAMDWDIWDGQILQQNAQQVDSWDDPQFTGAAPLAHSGIADAMPVTQNSLDDLQFNWQDLQDVDLDIRNYGDGGLWGKSPKWQT